MSLRRAIFWFHLIVGIVVGLVVFFFAATGSIMAFQPQIIRFAERAYIVTPPRTGEVCSAPSEVLTKAQREIGEVPTSFQIFSNPEAPALVMTAPDRVYLVNACSGALIGDGPSKVRAFFAHVRDLHRYVALSGKRYEGLHAITTAGNLGFALLIVSGLVLWAPRQLKKAHLRNALMLRKGLKARAREWNLHNVFGFWLAIPLLTISLSGSVMAYDWVNALLYKLAGSTVPQGKEERSKVVNLENAVLLDKLLPLAKASDPRWNSLTMRLPIAANSVAFALDRGTGAQPKEKIQLVISKNGKLTKFDTFEKLPRGRQWRLYGRYLHTGEIFGLTGQIVAFLAVLAAVVLVWTGFALSFRRFTAWRGRKARLRERPRVLEAV